MSRSLLYIIIFLGVGHSALSQNDSLFKAEILSYFDKISMMKEPGENEGFRMKYSTITEYTSKSEERTHKLDFVMTATKYLMEIESDLISVYMDSVDYFLISHNTNTINWTKGGTNKFTKARTDMLSGMQKNLYEAGKFTFCETIKRDGKTFHKSDISFPQSNSKNPQFNSVTIWYLVEEERIYRFDMHPQNQQMVKMQSIIYDRVEYGTAIKMKGSALSRVLDNNLQPANRYKDYSLINNR